MSINGVPIMNQNLSLITVDRNESKAEIGAKLNTPLTMTMPAVIPHRSYTAVYVGIGCGSGGLIGLIILYYICKS